MALNFADIFEHAADAFPDRVAVACEDRQVTYRELDERSNALAHHLAGIGVKPGDHVGLYARNSIEAIETLLASCKLRAATININYRYVENELRYMFADSDLAALVYDRQFAPLVAAVAPDSAGLRGTVVIDDGSDADIGTGTPYEAALAAASPERDFSARSNDDAYIIYTGGTTGHPKGVMWRSEDIWRTLGGGIDFATAVPLPDEWEQSRRWTQSWSEPGAPEPLPMPLQNLLVSDAHQRLMRSGMPDVVPMPVGQVVGRMNEVRPVADLISALLREADEALDRLHDLR